MPAIRIPRFSSRPRPPCEYQIQDNSRYLRIMFLTPHLLFQCLVGRTAGLPLNPSPSPDRSLPRHWSPVHGLRVPEEWNRQVLEKEGPKVRHNLIDIPRMSLNPFPFQRNPARREGDHKILAPLLIQRTSHSIGSPKGSNRGQNLPLGLAFRLAGIGSHSPRDDATGRLETAIPGHVGLPPRDQGPGVPENRRG